MVTIVSIWEVSFCDVGFQSMVSYGGMNAWCQLIFYDDYHYKGS